MTESNKGKTLRIILTRDNHLEGFVYYDAFYEKDGQTYVHRRGCNSLEKPDLKKFMESIEQQMGKGHLKNYSKLETYVDWENALKYEKLGMPKKENVFFESVYEFKNMHETLESDAESPHISTLASLFKKEIENITGVSPESQKELAAIRARDEEIEKTIEKEKRNRILNQEETEILVTNMLRQFLKEYVTHDQIYKILDYRFS